MPPHRYAPTATVHRATSFAATTMCVTDSGVEANRPTHSSASAIR